LVIQAVDDLVTGTLHTLERSDADQITPERRALAQELRDALLPCFDRHPHTAELEDVGIKRFAGAAPKHTQTLFLAPTH
jgi:hypothetical protein